jgi:hypothetical protein
MNSIAPTPSTATAGISGKARDDRDTLHILPLASLPIQHATLRKARMVKDSRLVSVVELFQDRDAGAGHIEVEHIPKKFQFPPANSYPDLTLLRQLALMPSYDVYSLRVTLRNLGVEVQDQSSLSLSPEKTRELASYMRNFTRPLLLQIYGDEALRIETFEHVVALFRDPDVQRAKRQLLVMAGKLGIDIMAIPRFLEDYADIFMSLSYYRQCLDDVTPSIYDFLESLKVLKKSYQLRTSGVFVESCREIELTFNDLVASVTGRLESFDRHTKDMWQNLSAERFRQIEKLIRTYHCTLGGILCALTVKMDAWSRLFPNRSAGSPGRRAEFIMSDLRQGLSQIRAIEKAAPAPSDFN